ncbi:hypothetical protein EU546_00850 [Candidatus Thorarchaeota archaeon]|nr:MAG: hypothetical protein EU546_00850 [Candidatus Thorarchaeota archaeon]
MRDSSLTEKAPGDSTASGNSYLVVILRNDRDFRRGARTTKAIRRLARGIYRVPVQNKRVREYVQRFRHLTLKRAREIPRVKETDPELSQRRTYVLIAYSFVEPTAQQKKKTQRLLNRSAYIRVRKGAVLFPHLRSKDITRFYHNGKGKRVLTPKEFAEGMKSIGAEISRWSRVRAVGLKSEREIADSLDTTIRSQLSSLETRITDLQERTKHSSVSVKTLKSRYSELMARIKEARSVYSLVRDIWKRDDSKILRKMYNRLLRCRTAIENRAARENSSR